MDILFKIDGRGVGSTLGGDTVIRILAFVLCALVATPGKTAVLGINDFVDFRADISSVETLDPFGFEFNLLEVQFDVSTTNINKRLDVLLGTSIGTSDIGSRSIVAPFDTTTGTAFFDNVTRSSLPDIIFARIVNTVDLQTEVSDLTVSALDTFNRPQPPIQTTQVSAVPVPAALVLFLSALGSLGYLASRRSAKAASVGVDRQGGAVPA